MKRMLVVLLAVALVATPVLAQEDEPKPADPKGSGFSLLPPGGYVGGWVFLLKAYYSGLDGVGVGAEVSRPFQVPLLSRYSDTDVELQFDGRIYEQAYGEFEARADATFGGSRWSTRAQFHHSTRQREFWGVGPDLPEDDGEQFRPREARLYVEVLRAFGRLRIGVRGELHDYQYIQMEPGGLLETGGYDGVTATGETVAGGGLSWDYDTRDDHYVATSGWRVSGTSMYFDAFRPGASGFANANLDVRRYLSTSPKNVFAIQAFTYTVNGEAPIWRYAVIGGREHTRGYSFNRYMDERLVAAQIEWRRNVFRQLGFHAFGGSAIVAPKWSALSVRHHHPTIGAGLSLVLRQVSRLAVRGELATGDDSLHGTLALGLAF